MDLKEMRERKRALGYSNETLAERSGVPLATVQKVLSGITRSPRQKTVEALASALYFEQPEGVFDMDAAGMPAAAEAEDKFRMTPDPGVAGGPVHTIEDIYALPAGTRAELIDGKMYSISTPTRIHQKITGEMYLAAAGYIKAQHKEWEVYIAPFSVFLEGDDSIYVEPDLSVISDPSKLNERGCNGAPDWIMEVVSASSRRTDYAVKLSKYMRAGVREYWIIDPGLRVVTVYCFGSSGDIEDAGLYSFDETIPCTVCEGLNIRPADMF